MLDKKSEEHSSCPVASVLSILSAKWTMQILRELSLGPVRTRGFLKTIPGLSMKSLQERLKELQNAGFIARFEYDDKPIRVEFTITPRGRRLYSALAELKAIAAESATTSHCHCWLENLNNSPN